MRKSLLLLMVILCGFSCSKKKVAVLSNHEELNGPITILYPRTIKKNEEFVAKMFSNDPKRKLVNAVVDCSDFTKINSETFKIQGCSKELLIKNDTVYLAFQPIATGDFIFKNVNLISTIISESDIQFHEVELKYKVIE